MYEKGVHQNPIKIEWGCFCENFCWFLQSSYFHCNSSWLPLTFDIIGIPNSHLTISAPTPQNGQTHSNNLSAIADELFECVWPFCGVGAERVNIYKLLILELLLKSINYLYNAEIYCTKIAKNNALTV